MCHHAMYIMIIISVFVVCITVSDFISCTPEFIMSIEGIFATDDAHAASATSFLYRDGATVTFNYTGMDN